jgi:hypothetical protein
MVRGVHEHDRTSAGELNVELRTVTFCEASTSRASRFVSTTSPSTVSPRCRCRGWRSARRSGSRNREDDVRAAVDGDGLGASRFTSGRARRHLGEVVADEHVEGLAVGADAAAVDELWAGDHHVVDTGSVAPHSNVAANLTAAPSRSCRAPRDRRRPAPRSGRLPTTRRARWCSRPGDRGCRDAG